MIRAIVTDIEGTTSSIAFVHEVLFPYSRRRLAEFIAEHGDDPEVRSILREVEGPDKAKTLLAWLDADKKITALKAIQGLIWRQGYERGELKAHLYPDVAPALARWRGRGLRIFVYSSGSVLAQKLFFAHTIEGDLSAAFAGWFDTTTGPKRERASYEAIARAIGIPPASILFLSDTVEEIDAARAAGFDTRWLARDAGPRADGGIGSFDEIELEGAAAAGANPWTNPTAPAFPPR